MTIIDLEQIVEAKWNSRNKKHFEEKGYKYTKMGDIFYVKAKDLTPRSKFIVEVVCDYNPNHKMYRKYQTYVRYHDKELGDCCELCKQEKIKKVFMNHYGTDNPFASEIVKSKIKKTNLEKYGVENPGQSKVIKEKIAQSWYKNGSVKTSKPQIEIYEMLQQQYGNCELNYPCGRCSLDCVININGIKIDVEFDGSHWHDDPDYDRRRDEFVKSQGYKVLRIDGRRKLLRKKNYLMPYNYC